MGNMRTHLTIASLIATALLAMLAGPAGAEKKKKPTSYRPISVSLIPPIALFNSKDTTVVGASVNLIYGRSRAVYGVEVGLLNRVDEDVGLLQLGALANYAGGGCYGLCAAGGVNFHGGLTGAQLALFGNEAGNAKLGLQVSLINVVRRNADFVVQAGLLNFNNRRLEDIAAALGAEKGDVITVYHLAGAQRGIQIGGANGSDDYRGIQLGFVNIAKHGKGLQVAAVNVSEKFAGIQIGAWNHATKVRGLQFGFVNTARSLKGVQLGIINVATANKLPFTVVVNAGF